MHITIKIESGIPIPERIVGRPRTSKWGFLSDMKNGDSFTISRLQSAAAFVKARRMGVKLTARKISDTEVRVWRIE